MELGPISAIRPISLGRPSPPGSEVNPDLNGVFAVELRDEQPDDSYSPSRQAARGLEDEDEGEESASTESAEPSSDASINFFA